MGRERIAVLVLLCIILATPILRAQPQSAQPQPQPAQDDWVDTVGVFRYRCEGHAKEYDWKPLAFLALLVSIFIIGGVYMLSMGFEMHRTNVWAKNELYQTLGTAVIIVALVGGIPLAESVGESISYLDDNPANDGNSSIRMALDYSASVANLMRWNFAGLTIVNGVVTLFGSLPVSMAPAKIAGATFSLEPIARPVLHALGIMITLMVTVMGEWHAHWFLLCFIKQRMLTLFLPLGVLLRAFPVTRWAGGLFISLALGFYFIYPLMININEGIGIPTPVENMKDMVSDFLTQDIWKIGLLMFALRFLSFSFAAVFISMMVIFLMYHFVPAVIYSVIILGIILPIFNIFITFTFVKELSKILGADVNLAAITKMI